MVKRYTHMPAIPYCNFCQLAVWGNIQRSTNIKEISKDINALRSDQVVQVRIPYFTMHHEQNGAIGNEKCLFDKLVSETWAPPGKTKLGSALPV
jgi:hypothetical protein